MGNVLCVFVCTWDQGEDFYEALYVYSVLGKFCSKKSGDFCVFQQLNAICVVPSYHFSSKTTNHFWTKMHQTIAKNKGFALMHFGPKMIGGFRGEVIRRNKGFPTQTLQKKSVRNPQIARNLILERLFQAHQSGLPS